MSEIDLDELDIDAIYERLDGNPADFNSFVTVGEVMRMIERIRELHSERESAFRHHNEMTAATATIQALRDALEFYGEKNNHHDVPFGENQWKASPVCFDGGKRARRALAETEADEKPAEKVDPDTIQWRDGETKRMVGNTLVYRSYEDYCDD